jgi:hypothetical protein
MSALGHKQTFAVQKVMSALPPTVTAKADIRWLLALEQTPEGSFKSTDGVPAPRHG